MRTPLTVSLIGVFILAAGAQAGPTKAPPGADVEIPPAVPHTAPAATSKTMSEQRSAQHVDAKAREILSRAIEASGGIDALQKARTLVYRGAQQQPNKAPTARFHYEVYVARPDRFKEIIDSLEDRAYPRVIAWDGKAGWMSEVYGEVSSLPIANSVLYRWKTQDLASLQEFMEQGVEVGYGGEQIIDGQTVDVIQFHWPVGTSDYAFRRTDSTLFRIRFPMGKPQEVLGQVCMDTLMSDYRRVAGLELRLPHRVEYRQISDVSTIVQAVNLFETITVNEKLDDAIFTKPANNLPPPPAGARPTPAIKRHPISEPTASPTPH